VIADLKPYLEYKDSGLPWLGAVPKHWEVRRLKQICRFAYGDSLPSETRREGSIPVFGSNGPVGFHSSPNTMAPSIIIGRKGSFGKVNFSSEPVFAIDTTFFVDRRFTDANIRWLAYVLSFLRLDEVSRDSAVPGLDREEAYQRLVAYPAEREEQSAIARFLDHAYNRIGRYVHAKRKLMALLNERKQAIIHHAVTRGLDASAPLKPCSIPWIGNIPQHWEVMRLKRTCSLVRDGTHLPPVRTPKGFPLLSVRNIMGGRLVRRPDDSFISEVDFEKLNNSFDVRPNDVLMAIVGATLGKVAIVDDIVGPFQIQRSVSILRPRSELMTHDFLATFLRSPRLQQHLWQSVAFSAQPGIYLGFLANISLPVPPTIAEQVSIHESLQRELSPVGAAISRLEREIELLREYRARLVADVVTGKLDVREAAAHPAAEAAADAAEDDSDLSTDAEAADEEAVV
jgi:type I restriction enzyme, S subunit